MPERRTKSSSTPRRPTRIASLGLALALVALVGIGLGLGLSRNFFPRAGRPAPVQTLPPTSRAPRTPTLVTPLAVNDQALDAAVRRALARIGAIVQISDREQSVQEGERQLQWRTRTIEIRMRGSAEEAALQLGQEAERAGGKVFSRSSSGVQIGIIQDGRSLVTHEVRFIPTTAEARVAIIFDDAGGSLTDLEEIITLGRPVTIAVLPGLRYSREVAARAREAGLEVLLHLPLEPEDATKELGPGGITTAMSDEEIAQIVRTDLAEVPGAIGVNNHMGSRATADPRVMRAVFQVVKAQGLVFVDSVTSPRSIAAHLASEMHIRAAARQVFLDNQDEPEAIRQQVERLITVARKRGEAVAIGHAHRLTARVLKEMLAEFDRQHVEIVPVSALVR